MFGIVFLGFDFKAMSKYDERLRDWYERTNGGKLDEVSDTKLHIVEHGVDAQKGDVTQSKGKVADLVIPILLLIIFCMAGMVYSGGYFDASSKNYLDFIDAFAESNASIGLVIGSLAAFILTIILFVARKTLPFHGLVASSAAGLQQLLPAIIFVVAAFLAFATGTSWGTFGILIPICIAVFPTDDPLRIISISACMAGAVCGDHISPISDTTIMASAGAECKHVHHVSSQLPYALTVALVSFLTFLVAGFTQSLGIIGSAIVSWICGIILLASALMILKKKK